MKLFKVTRTNNGWNWSEVEWVHYYLAENKAIVTERIIEDYGKLDKYFYNEEESHISIEEREYIELP